MARRNRNQSGFAWIVLVLLIAGAVGLWVFLEQDKPTPLKAQIVPAGPLVTISSQEQRDLADCMLEVNESHRSGRFVLKAGEFVQFNLVDLTMSDGARFNPRTQRVAKAELSCRLPGGTRGVATFGVN